jgi:hypothetical protein
VGATGGERPRPPAGDRRTSAEAQERLDAARLTLRRDGATLRVELQTPPERIAAQEFTVRVPASLALELRTTNGAISVAGVSGTVDARAANGAVSLANTTGPATLETTNGSIAVRLPAGAGASLDLQTTNGSISVPAAGAQGTRRLQSAIGAGGPPITARAGNGSISVTQGS